MIVATKKRQIIEPGFLQKCKQKTSKTICIVHSARLAVCKPKLRRAGYASFLFYFDAPTMRQCDNMLELQ